MGKASCEPEKRELAFLFPFFFLIPFLLKILFSFVFNLTV